MAQAFLLPERIVAITAVPSLFGGLRARLLDLPRQVPGALDLDVARWCSRDAVLGQPRRVAALCRRQRDHAAPNAAPVDDLAGPDDVAAAVVALLQGHDVTALATLPRHDEHPAFLVLRPRLEQAGITIDDVSAPSPVWAVDDAEVIDLHDGKTVCDAGQAALLATGLASDLAAWFVEAAGPAGQECFDKGFDDVARALFVQRIERAVRQGFSSSSVLLDGSRLVPPLSAASSRLRAADPDALSDKARALLTEHRRQQERQRQTLAQLVVEVRLPAARATWWADKLQPLVGGLSSPLPVLATTPTTWAALAEALAPGVELVEAPAQAVSASASALAPIAGSWSSPSSSSSPPFPPALSSPVPATRSVAVGGVRGFEEADLAPSLAPAPVTLAPLVAPAAAAARPVIDPAVVAIPPVSPSLRVIVDGVAVGLDPQGRDRQGVIRLAWPVRHGSVVVVVHDDPADRRPERP